MNLSTGIKSRDAALEYLGALAAQNSEEKISKLPATQQTYARNDAVLEKLAVALAIERVTVQACDVVNVTIRTSAGPSELISVHIVKH